MRALVLITAAAGVLVAASASAQSIRIGPGGVRVENDRPRVERRIIERRDVSRTGSTRCRTTIVRRENRFGEQVTRRIRECD